MLVFTSTPVIRPVLATTHALATTQARSATPVMGVVETIASPLTKMESPAVAQAGGSPLDGLPLEVQLLFGTIVFVGIAGLAKSSGVDVVALAQSIIKFVSSLIANLTGNGSTAGLEQPPVGSAAGDEPMAASPVAASEDESDLSQGEKERKYFSILAEEQAQKRGGTKTKRKKIKKAKK